MATSSYGFEGTTGDFPGSWSGTFPGLTGPSAAPTNSATCFDISTTRAHLGNKSGRVRATSYTTQAYYYTNSPGSTIYFRGYFYIDTAALSSHVTFLSLFGAEFGYINLAGISGSTRKLYCAAHQSGRYDTDGFPSATYESSNDAVPLNEWCRIEIAATRTTIEARLWTTSGSGGVDSTGAAHVASGVVTGTDIGAPEGATLGPYTDTTFIGSYPLYLDGFAVSDAGWIGPDPSVVAAAASGTASGTAVATTTRVLSGTPSITATGEATAGKVGSIGGTPSITAAGAADAAVIATHNAEAAAIVTASVTDAMSMIRTIAAASTITLSATGAAALDGGAEAVVHASASAGARIDGETSPGFLYSTVNKNVLTS